MMDRKGKHAMIRYETATGTDCSSACREEPEGIEK